MRADSVRWDGINSEDRWRRSVSLSGDQRLQRSLCAFSEARMFEYLAVELVGCHLLFDVVFAVAVYLWGH